MNFESFVLKFAGKENSGKSKAEFSNGKLKIAHIAIEYIKLGNKYFLADTELKELVKQLNTKAEAIGLFLGEDKNEKFTPSLALLEALSEVSDEKVIVNNIGELDFLYKKDIKRRHIKSFTGGAKEGFLKLIVNEHDDCIGYGKISKDLGSESPEIANMLDRGDFLRREKH